ncbi:MAG: M48 family metallopeptidase [Planctomycetota bacterium]
MWEQIRSNQRRSFLVVSLMGVLLVAMGMAVGALLVPDEGGLVLGGLVALFVWFVLWLVTVSGGDDILLGLARAREIRKQDHPQLFNVVEEMTIASSLGKPPRVFIVDDASPNAFATGRRPDKAAVAVTTGLLRLLDRNELQGVVAHEIGHIKNRDVALMTTTGIMLGTIVLLADLGTRMLWLGGGRRSRSSSGGGGQAQAVILVVAIVFMILAPILAQLVYFALSRRREYLADASGAMFTRYPEGLASALEKLGGSRAPLADESRVTAPMYIVQPLRARSGRRASSLFATHPPIEERIRILRGMAGGAGLREYAKAYEAIKRRSLVGNRTLKETESVEMRAAGAVEGERPHERARMASNAVLTAAGYDLRTCKQCGATLKIPPSLRGKLRGCPRCDGSLE